MLKRLLPILLLLMPLLTWAQEYVNAASDLHFPQRLDAFERIGVQRYPDPKLGVQVGYAVRGLGKADFYIYDLGLTAIPDGPDSKPVQSAYADADQDVQNLAQAGNYLDLKRLLPLGSTLRAPRCQLVWAAASYQFRINREGGQPMTSWLLVTGYHQQFLKIRFSYLTARAKEGRAALDGLLQALEQANKLEPAPGV
jgi:hypothetical protein